MTTWVGAWRIGGRYPFLTSIAFALLWTAIGLAIAAMSGNSNPYVLEWLRLQGTINLAIGVWLLISAFSNPLDDLLRNLGVEPQPSKAVRFARAAILFGVAAIGSASLISLGFNGSGVVLGFLNLTCVVICALAAVATWHGIEILIASKAAGTADLHVFVYSPAETKELRFLARHASTYAAVLTLGYAFTLAATLLSRWTADPLRVRAVITFWPMLYVPFCMFLLFYPQIQFRKLIRREKERLMSVCQDTIDDVLKKEQLTTDDVQRCNALADLFDKVAATPEYIIDLGIVSKMLWVVGVNAVTLILPREYIASVIRGYLG